MSDVRCQIFLIIVVLIIHYSSFITPALAGHCNEAGSFNSLNSYCEPSTNTVWQDQEDCSHTDTGQACPTLPQPEPQPSALEPEQPAQPFTEQPQTTPSSPSPDCNSTTISSHEKGLCNLNRGLLPSQLAAETKPIEEKNIFQKIADLFAGLFGFKPKAPEYYVPNADNQNNADLPNLGCEAKDIIQETAQNLGNNECPGVYNVDLPKEVAGEAKNIDQIEDIKAKSWFPEGINPWGNDR